MRRRLFCIAIVTAALAAPATRAAGPPTQGSAATVEIALVANAVAGTVALFDVKAMSIAGVIDINPAKAKATGFGAPNAAQDTDVSPDGRTLYVSRAYVGDVAAFDISTGKLLWTRPLSTARADHMTITPDGRYLFVSAMPDDRVYRIATATGEPAGQFQTGMNPHDNQISADGRRVYNTSLGPLRGMPRAGQPAPPPGGGFQITVADVQTLAIVERISVDTGIRPWKFTPDHKSLYAQRSNEHAVAIFDLATHKFGRRLELPVKPGVVEADFDFEAPHHGLALTDDGRTLCLAGRASDYVALVRAPELTLITTIPVGDAPGWAETADNGRVCLVPNTRSDDLSVISIPERKEVKRVAIGDGPKHVTVVKLPAAVVAAVRKGA